MWTEQNVVSFRETFLRRLIPFTSVSGKINFVIANGFLFEHPLFHLGKTSEDLPLIAIDSLKHMFSYPYNSSEDLVNLEKLHRFLNDFYSEKLHLRFHNVIFEELSPSVGNLQIDDNQSTMVPSDQLSADASEIGEDDVPIVKDSDFIKLYPSHKRYTLKRRVHDEL
ncbi:hypothetical protein M8J75_004230 [Diaphorina citri]|nr:hypothetical protein M8J75_004230 [Diaphorina citri]